ncbi:MAG: GNAT family N-acetyltransferase [Candidatus Limnocylindria bacterium]
MVSRAVQVRDATPSDSAAIRRVAQASWRETYRDIFASDFIEGFLDEHYGVEPLERAARVAVERETSAFLVAERRGRVVAYLQFGDGPRGPELFRIYAHPDAFGTGAGTALLDELHRRIDGRVGAYVLDVHSRNVRGRAFYDRHGFVIIGGGATEDCDLTLRRTLHPAHAPIPIETDRLRLRALEATDSEAAALHRIYGDAETMRYVGGRGAPSDNAGQTRRALEWFVRHQQLHGFSLWAMDERDGDSLVGVAGLLWVEGHGPEVEVAYVLRRDRWGRGYATEAARAALDVGLGPLGHERIVALSYPENVASQRVMAKVGMRPDGTATAYGREMVRYATLAAAP